MMAFVIFCAFFLALICVVLSIFVFIGEELWWGFPAVIATAILTCAVTFAYVAQHCNDFGGFGTLGTLYQCQVLENKK